MRRTTKGRNVQHVAPQQQGAEKQSGISTASLNAIPILMQNLYVGKIVTAQSVADGARRE